LAFFLALLGFLAAIPWHHKRSTVELTQLCNYVFYKSIACQLKMTKAEER